MCCEYLSTPSTIPPGKETETLMLFDGLGMIKNWMSLCELMLENISCLIVCLRYREIAGFEGVLAGCLVALKQIMPDNEVVVLKVIRFRVKVRCRST